MRRLKWFAPAALLSFALVLGACTDDAIDDPDIDGAPTTATPSTGEGGNGTASPSPTGTPGGDNGTASPSPTGTPSGSNGTASPTGSPSPTGTPGGSGSGGTASPSPTGTPSGSGSGGTASPTPSTGGTGGLSGAAGVLGLLLGLDTDALDELRSDDITRVEIDIEGERILLHTSFGEGDEQEAEQLCEKYGDIGGGAADQLSIVVMDSDENELVDCSEATGTGTGSGS